MQTAMTTTTYVPANHKGERDTCRNCQWPIANLGNGWFHDDGSRSDGTGSSLCVPPAGEYPSTKATPR